MIVSFTFNLYDQFFPEDKSGQEFTYARWPLGIKGKIWGQSLTLSEVGLLSYIVTFSGINRTQVCHRCDIGRSQVGHDRADRIKTSMEKFQRLGLISNLKFGMNLAISKQVSKTGREGEQPPLVEDIYIYKHPQTSTGTQTKRRRAPRRDASVELPDWKDLKDEVIANAKSMQGYSDQFCEERWMELVVYDEGKPYKNRKLAAVNWFNSNITKEKWIKRPKTKDDEVEEARIAAKKGGIIF